MTNVTFDSLYQVSLTTLATAVADWKKVADRLDVLADSARDEMQAQSDKARWTGENAGVTRPFVNKTANEFRDAQAEAKSVWSVLRDAHADLTDLQSKLKTVADTDARTLGVQVADNGDGTVRCVFPHVRGDTDERPQEQFDSKQSLEDRINQLLANAREIDDSTARALKKIHGNDLNDFGHSTYSSLDDAQKERALELAKLGPEMNAQQYAEFNTLMKFNADDPAFAAGFYQGLGGPEEALRFFGQMSIDGTEGDDKARLALSQEMQRAMGATLATATDPDNKPHLPASWGDDFRRLGTQPINLTPDGWNLNRPYGYQVLGGLLRYGDYDPSFINPIAEHITQLHHDDPYRFMANKPIRPGDLDYGFNLDPPREF
jgi:hypothetical protein